MNLLVDNQSNCRKMELLDAFAKLIPSLRELLAAGNAVIEVR